MNHFRVDTICNITQEQQELREIRVCLWVHRQVCCNKISSIGVKSLNINGNRVSASSNRYSSTPLNEIYENVTSQFHMNACYLGKLRNN